jgi:hypothetical protein
MFFQTLKDTNLISCGLLPIWVTFAGMKGFPVLISLLLLLTAPSRAQFILRGTVIDSSSHQPLAFVNIVAGSNAAGVSTDIDGKFSFPSDHPVSIIRCSYLGYQTKEITMNSGKPLVVKMRRKAYQLTEVKILPGINPANRIMQLASANGEKNNPEKSTSFTYTSYNKFYVTADIKSATDTINSFDSLGRKESKVQKFFDQRHLFITESVSKRKYRRPGRNHELIIASRTSGLKTPLFTFLGNQMQSFSFYDKTIKLLDRVYMSPLVPGNTAKYLFVIEDTLYSGKDSVFVISFRPKHGKNFDALKGVLYINSNQYAIQNVIAEPAVTEGLFTIKIQQKYEYMGDKQWFPSQLNTDLYYNDFSVTDSSLVINAGTKPVRENNEGKLKVVSRSYIRDVVLEPELKKNEFGSLEIEIDPEAADKDEAFWNKFRVDSLNRRDRRTYRVLDSLGKASHLDLKIKALTAFLDGQIPYKYICFDINRFLDENRYENIRAGIGIHTSKRLSAWFTAGGYVGYGFGDKELKYGGDASFFPNKKNHDYAVSYAWSHDLAEAGGISFFQDNPMFGGESFRHYLIEVFDKQELQKLSLRFRAMNYFLVNLYFSDESREATNAYRYGVLFGQGLGSVSWNRFLFTESGLQVKYIYREKFSEFLDKRISQGSDYPVVFFNLAKGFNNLPGFDGQYNYMKYELRISKTFITAKFGKPTLQVLGGLVDGHVPYSKLFAGHGSFVNYTLDAPNTFETMGLNEFLSDRYLALFYSHNFGRLLIRTAHFQPELILVNRFGFGSLSHPENQFNISYKTMEKGYCETGLLLNNILRSGYLGIGAGVYYRYGAYAFRDETQNIALKFSFSFNF